MCIRDRAGARGRGRDAGSPPEVRGGRPAGARRGRGRIPRRARHDGNLRDPRASAMTGIRAPVPDPLDAFDGSTFVRNGVLFTRALRSAGVVTDLGGALDFARALTLVDLGDRTQVHAAGSAIFCRRRLELEIYDAVFDQFWRRHTARIAPTGLEVLSLIHI